MPTIQGEPEWLRKALDEARREGRLTEAGRCLPPGAAKRGNANRAAVEAGKEFEATVIAEARHAGWLVAHFRPTRQVRKDGTFKYLTAVGADGKGFPDLVLVRARVIFAELKGGKSGLEPAQRRWRGRLLGSGAEWYLWRPDDMDTIRRILT